MEHQGEVISYPGPNPNLAWAKATTVFVFCVGVCLVCVCVSQQTITPSLFPIVQLGA